MRVPRIKDPDGGIVMSRWPPWQAGYCSGCCIRKQTLWSPEPVVIPESMSGTLKYVVRHWSEHVYPMGNGRLGFTVFGDPDRERIQFNEDSLWVGNEDYTGGYQPFGDDGELLVLHVAIDHLVRVLDTHVDLAILLDDRDVMLDADGVEIQERNIHVTGHRLCGLGKRG